MFSKILSKLPPSVRKSYFLQEGYCRLGLKHDDTYMEHPYLEEAVRRLPKKLQDERTFRQVRAIQLSLSHSLLPKDQWTKFEDEHNYLEPYLKEVEAEANEIKEWYKNH